MRYSRLKSVRSISSSHILSLHKKSIGWADGVKITSRRYYGRRKPLLRGQDGRVVKAPNFHCRERTKYTPDKRGFDPVPQKKSIGWADGVKITSRRYYGWRQSRYFFSFFSFLKFEHGNGRIVFSGLSINNCNLFYSHGYCE